MSKWRPSDLNCLYVIPDIHGNLQTLNLILDRILPLRKSDGGKDLLVFLGDYIDRHLHAHLVLDRLIEVQAQAPSQIIFLLGNHESILLKALNMVPGKEITLQDRKANYQMWLRNGGMQTLMGYLDRAGRDLKEAASLEPYRLSDLIPAAHIKFLQSLQLYWQHEHYIFVHAGLDPTQPNLAKQEPEQLIWDRKLYSQVLEAIENQTDLPWEGTIVAGHNSLSGSPTIHPKFLMLDCGSPAQLLVSELHSMTGCLAINGNERLIKLSLTPTLPTSKNS